MANGVSHGYDDAARGQRIKSIESCIQSLMCTVQCSNCILTKCHKMKRVVEHSKKCRRRMNGGCSLCKQLIALCCYHSKSCQENKCPMPFCANIKYRILQKTKQPENKNTV